MGKISAILGIATLAGLGFYVGKKLIEKKNREEELKAEHIYDDEPDVFVEEIHSSPKEKLQKASLFAVGAIKTGTEKFKEGIDSIINSNADDMVAKGEETLAQTKVSAAEKKEKALEFAKTAKDKTVEFAKGAGETIKTEIDNIKNKLSSINTTPAEEQSDDNIVEAVEDAAEELAGDIGEAVKEAADDISDTAADAAEAVADAAAAVEEKAEEAKDDLDKFDFGSTGSIETFDFSEDQNGDSGSGSL